jgi:hypothetical protein
MNKRVGIIITTIGLLTLIVIWMFIVTGLVSYPTQKMDVLAVSKINLLERGGLIEGEYRGGVWRILADTRESKLQFLKFNRTLLEQWGALEPDMDVVGNIEFTVRQKEYPYLIVPWKEKIATYTVYPTVYSTEYKGVNWLGEPINEKGDIFTSIPAKKVDVYRVDWDSRKLVIPFEVKIEKTIGQNPGELITDYPGAVKTPTGWWKFYISEIEIVKGGNYTRDILWYNPLDPTETATMHLQFTTGSSEFDVSSSLEGMFVITDEGGGFLSSVNAFEASAGPHIESFLNYSKGWEWNFANYWFGGGPHFKGTTVYLELQVGEDKSYAKETGEFKRWDDDNSPAALVGPVRGIRQFYYLVAEGYILDEPRKTSEANPNWGDIYEYPGWYVPDVLKPDNWYNKRIPVNAYVYNNRIDTIPMGYSICNYMAMGMKAPVTGDEKPVILFRISESTLNRHGLGYEGMPPKVPYKVYYPLSSRSWTYTLDVSTELADAVVVVQEYANVKIMSYDINPVILDPGKVATLKIETKNIGYAGFTSAVLNVPSNLDPYCAVTGAIGENYWEAGDNKTLYIYIKNLGGLTKSTSGTFTLKMVNRKGEITSGPISFDLIFNPGVLVDETVLPIKVVEKDTNKPLAGIHVQVWYGFDMESYKDFITLAEGVASFTLDYFEGEVHISVSDPSGKYLPQNRTVRVSRGVNPTQTFELVRKPIEPSLLLLIWEKYQTYIIAGAVATTGIMGVGLTVYYYKKKYIGYRR